MNSYIDFRQTKFRSSSRQIYWMKKILANSAGCTHFTCRLSLTNQTNMCSYVSNQTNKRSSLWCQCLGYRVTIIVPHDIGVHFLYRAPSYWHFFRLLCLMKVSCLKQKKSCKKKFPSKFIQMYHAFTISPCRCVWWNGVNSPCGSGYFVTFIKPFDL